ncbi:coiled-coil domain-containing protein 114 isoform X1 [Coregonus clupeaformis]|uniref:coiled-coil domain-containing protein 114 isoform X1 n=2 Tax=Coregonus clupeaformis TaxID=59861 RepID=UPI001BE062DC|nr:coiled-coil domain-containing protein 114 isoform X1 [Coregonus clupeaformis]XP_041745033.1 coiled-coil domain-containing protein 114 isoform X1 [Coregonus clupeaformis]
MPRGRSATSVHSDSSDMDIDGIAETEMGKLQRQFRIMGGDRLAYSIQSQDHIRRQRQEIENLEKEQEELQRSLCVSESLSRRQQDSEDAQTLRSMLEQRDEVGDEVEMERQSQAELEQEISIMERKLAELRRGEVTATLSQKSQSRHTQKASRTLENKLDRALIRFNKQLTKNSHLREDLESLRVERVRFQQLHRRLDKELQEIRKDIGDMVSLATAAYDVRVEAQSKMIMMREKAVKDLSQYSAEMKELERVIAHERRLKEFMTTKCSERSGQDEGQELGRRHEVKEQRRMDSGEESVDTLEEVFQRIQNITGEDDLDMLVTRFIQVEDQNFALFNYVNEQNNEAEALRDQINQTQREMEQFNVTGQQQEQEHHALLRDLDQQQRDTESQAHENEVLASAVSKILDQIKTGVNSVFHKMDCDRSLVEDLLGSSSGIRENNIMTYLGLVEQRTNQLLTMQAFLSSRDLDKEYDPKDLARFLLGQNPEVPRQNIIIQPPVTGDDYDTEESPLTDEEERPLSQGELRKRIMKGVLLKEGSVRHAAARRKMSVPSNSRRRSLEA